ncbi:MAG: RtcB family protein [Chloroflexota bacterium]
MTTETFMGRDLIDHGWQPGAAIGFALQAGRPLLAQGVSKAEVLAELALVHETPDSYIEHATWGATAQQLQRVAQRPQTIQLREEPAPLTVWGEHLIDKMSYEQIDNAARLPVTLRVALMPDAHVGYGLPIGGVAALEGAIAPYMVGVDIGCRMHATIFKRNPIHLQQAAKLYEDLLWRNTFFGRSGPSRSNRNQHAIMDDPRWEQLPKQFRQLKDKAHSQLGTSGGGNHFVEWTALTVESNNPLGLKAGRYIALVSHSGSRGMGHKLASFYSRVAEQVCSFLPESVRKLAYFDHRTENAIEYELAMNLAGDYAKANHEVIHKRISEALGGEVVGTVQNHHNFAWRVAQEDAEGSPPIFVHRKGATPAAKGDVGIVPGSMATPGFFVTGLGETAVNILNHPALNSASHGSGRTLGRRQAQRELDLAQVRAKLAKKGIKLLGGGIDEAPEAYKDSREVIAAQSDLVEVWAEFEPKIVRMDSGGKHSLVEH